MDIARHGDGPLAAVRALLSQVHPVFMLPPLSASLFGALLAAQRSVGFAAGFDPALAALHVLAAFFALYTAHVTDGYVDFYVREEDDDHPLTLAGCRLARAGASVAFFACLLAVGWAVDAVAAALTLPGWLIGYHHAPTLDTNPVTATVGYPTGIAVALVGGYYVQATALSATVVALAGVFLVVLSGIKVIDDAQDYDYDRSIDKRTVAVVVGPELAYRAAYALMATGMVAVVALAVGIDGIPPTAALAPVVFGSVALVATRAGPELATMLLIRGSYLFLAVLLATVWFRPLG